MLENILLHGKCCTRLQLCPILNIRIKMKGLHSGWSSIFSDAHPTLVHLITSIRLSGLLPYFFILLLMALLLSRRSDRVGNLSSMGFLVSVLASSSEKGPPIYCWMQYPSQLSSRGMHNSHFVSVSHLARMFLIFLLISLLPFVRSFTRAITQAICFDV